MQSLGSGQKSVRWRSRRCIATSPTRSRSSAQPGRCMMSTVEGAPSHSRTPPRAATARACRARRATAGCLLPLTGVCGPGSGAQSASSASGVMWQSVPCTTVFKSGGSCGRQKGDPVRPAQESSDIRRERLRKAPVGRVGEVTSGRVLKIHYHLIGGDGHLPRARARARRHACAPMGFEPRVASPNPDRP